MAVVRLEAANSLSKEMEKYFCEKFNIRPECIFRTKMPMKLDFIFAIADKLPDSKKKRSWMYHFSATVFHACRG